MKGQLKMPVRKHPVQRRKIEPLELVVDNCDACDARQVPTVEILLQRWGAQAFTVNLDEPCLTKAMLLIRPFSVTPNQTWPIDVNEAPSAPKRPRPDYMYESPESDVEG